MKIVSLDIGTVRIGVASSDIMEIIASPYAVVRRTNQSTDIQKIAEIINNLNAGLVVIGLPLKLDGSEGQSVAMARSFGDELQKFISAEIVYQDERLSTVTAQKILIEQGVRREKRKDKVDSLAATIILQTFLDKRSNMKKA